MNKLYGMIKRIHLVTAFIVLLIFHFLLYYLLGNSNWLILALSASLVDTAILAALQFIADKAAGSQD
jgi:hypothetical protein